MPLIIFTAVATFSASPEAQDADNITATSDALHFMIAKINSVLYNHSDKNLLWHVQPELSVHALRTMEAVWQPYAVNSRHHEYRRNVDSANGRLP